MSRNPRDRLKDIVRAIDDIGDFIGEMDREAFLLSPVNDRKTFRAVSGCLLEIGEAVKHLPEEITDRHPDIPWRAIGSMRDRIAHEYFQVDAEIVWETIQEGDLVRLLDIAKAEIVNLDE